jgi:hypothetical protein
MRDSRTVCQPPLRITVGPSHHTDVESDYAIEAMADAQRNQCHHSERDDVVCRRRVRRSRGPQRVDVFRVVKGSYVTLVSRIGWGAFLGLSLSLAVSPVRADVVAVISSTSAVTTLSKAQVTDIFLGKVSRFPNGTLATPIDQVEGSPARDEFYATYAGQSPAQIKSHWAKIIFTGRGQPPKAAANNAEIRKLLAANPQAISYIERSALDSSIRVLVQP